MKAFCMKQQGCYSQMPLAIQLMKPVHANSCAYYLIRIKKLISTGVISIHFIIGLLNWASCAHHHLKLDSLDHASSLATLAHA